MKSRKVVIIIEDEERPFNSIKEVISDDYPNDKQRYTKDDTFVNFRNILRNALSINHTDPEEPGKSKKLLLDKLKSYCDRDKEPIYLIDFLLDGDQYHPSINGIHFHKLIHNELYKNKRIPTFFITAAEGTNLARVQRYCEKDINDKNICHFRPKPDEWNDIEFKNDIIDFIKNAQSKPIIEQNNESKRIEDTYEPD
jgi:hypothetical protein